MKKSQIQKLAVSAVLGAIVAILSFIPLRTMGLEITFSMVPIAVGAIVYGPAVGTFLGGVFGAVSFIQCIIGYSAFGAVLFSINPFLTFVVCVPTRILAGLLTALIFKGLSRVDKTNQISFAVSSLAAAVLNTALFMGTLVLCFYNCDYIQSFVSALGATNPLMFVILFVGINGLVELICGFVIAYPASKAVSIAVKRLR